MGDDKVKCPECGGRHDDPDSMGCSLCNCRFCGGRGMIPKKEADGYAKWLAKRERERIAWQKKQKKGSHAHH